MLGKSTAPGDGWRPETHGKLIVLFSQLVSYHPRPPNNGEETLPAKPKLPGFRFRGKDGGYSFPVFQNYVDI